MLVAALAFAGELRSGRVAPEARGPLPVEAEADAGSHERETGGAALYRDTQPPVEEHAMAHSNPSDDELRNIYESTHVIAVVGASENPEKPAHQIPAYLQRHGYRIIPVKPGGGEVLGEPVVPRLADVDEPIDVVEVFRPADETPAIAEEAAAAGAKVLWLQTGIANDEAAAIAHERGLTVVMDKCMRETHRVLGLGGHRS